MPDEEGGREGGEGGWMEIESSTCYSFFFVGFGFGFSKRDGAGIRGIGSVYSFFWLGVAFVLVGSGLSSWL